MPGRFPPLLLIALVLLAGCMAPAPEDTPATIPATGSVAVSSTPPGAEVYLDNEYRGTTPVTVTASAGSHTLGLRLGDYQPWSKSILVEGGLKVSVDATLARIPAATTPATPLPTTKPATEPTTPAPAAPAGCWVHAIVTADYTVTYTYVLDPGGTGMLICTGIAKCLPPEEMTWSRAPDPLDPEHAALVTLKRIDPLTRDSREYVLTWDARADVLAFGESDNHVIFMKRTACPVHGITTGAG